jgi:hypothetical protein
MVAVVWYELEPVHSFGSVEGTWVRVAHFERWRVYECPYLRGTNGVDKKDQRNAGRKENRVNRQVEESSRCAREASELSTKH